MTVKKNKHIFPAIIEKDESGYYFAKVPTIKGCHTQAKTLSELYKRLDEVIQLCLEVEEKENIELSSVNEFVGFQQVEVIRPQKIQYA
ncbi:MAG: type II toxin-antitoxin system HicB family antitoxin [Patescibacteria group bacterium]